MKLVLTQAETDRVAAESFGYESGHIFPQPISIVMLGESYVIYGLF